MQNKLKQIHVILIAIGVISSIAFATQVYAQISPTNTSKIFIKDNNISILDTFRDLSGNELSYDRINYNPEIIIIHKWNNITELDKQLIIAELTTKGYVEKEEFNPQNTDGEIK